jgi:PIN domain nuclease of toxin-antitoxin system
MTQWVIGKLKFDHDWIDIISAGYFEVIDLKMDHILETRRLPLIHKDPFDRMIIAQSIVEGIPLITSDQKIQQYDFPYVKV